MTGPTETLDLLHKIYKIARAK